MRSFRLVPLAVLGSVLAGCGGGSGSSGASTPEIEMTIGDFTVRAAATNPPVTTAASASVATGVTGSFTFLRLRENAADVSDSRLVVGDARTGSGDLYTFSHSGGANEFRVSNSLTTSERNPAWNNAGNKIVCEALSGGQTDLHIYRSDGVFLSSLGAPLAQERDPDWSPDGTKVIFERAGSLIIADATTAVESVVATGGNAFNPSWSSRNVIAFETTRNGTTDIYIVNLDGTGLGGAVSGLSADTEHDPVWSADGEDLYWAVTKAGDDDIFRWHRSAFGASSQAIHTTPDVIGTIDISPDGEQITYQTGSILKRRDFRDASNTLDIYDSIDPLYGFSWGPIVRDRLFVGAGGLLAPSAAGFIYSDLQDKTTSVLVFDAVTRSSVILRAQTGIGGTQSSLVFALDADTVKLIKYANGPDWRAISAVETGGTVPSANGALISISSSFGIVNAVLPFNGTRSQSSQPTVTRDGSNYVFTGSFSAAMDATGKNVAPQGASRVVLNPDTGALTAG